MRLFPDRNLQHWVFGWFVLAVASVPLLGLRMYVPVAAVLLVAASIADGWLTLSEVTLEIERTRPETGTRL